MSPNPAQETKLHPGHSWLLRYAITIACALAMIMAVQAHGTVMTGDHFTSVFTETSGPDIGLTATADITIGAPASPGFFHISGFLITIGDVCFSCGLLTEVLTGVLFDATTFDLLGHITGTFLGSGGNLHTFDLALTDPAATWTFTNVRVFDGRTVISSGTYSPAVLAVDEPSILLLFGLGAVGLGWVRRRARR